ncbi:MAG: bifunctional folylpolyglutamate synthase/dihydrofolate synthase [Bacteroidales bacterium]|nr:bifunctional folylpolyglutamate synthase/dihydrofolate synthase [Bacteroidales bacterium]
MNYQEIIEYLISQLPMYQRTGKAAYKEGLENTLKLDAYFNSPHKKYPTIHVGGTNGKGSVCHMLASVLQTAGYEVGLHTSPHLIDFRERIRVNGEMMDKQAVVEFISYHKDFFRKVQPSFFEMSVFMAFDYFAKEKVNAGVIEVGLGGRLDSTNIIRPVLSVITNIGMDHTEFLGDTLEKIAAEKAGIIKDKTPVVIGEAIDITRPVFEKTAKIHHAKIIFAQEEYQAEYGMLSMNGHQVVQISDKKKNTGFSVQTDLLGFYQRKNLVTLFAALDELIAAGFQISSDHITNGLKNVKKITGFRGRWDICSYNPLLVCDTAHNSEGVAEVVRQIAETPYRKLHMIIGFVADKDLNTILSLMPRDAFYYFTRPSVPRGLDQKQLATAAEKHGLKGKVFSSVTGALAEAGRKAHKDDMVFVGGSTFLVADFLESEIL